MKRTILVILIVALTFSIESCGGCSKSKKRTGSREKDHPSEFIRNTDDGINPNRSVENFGLITGAIYDEMSGNISLISEHGSSVSFPTMQQVAVSFHYAFADSSEYNHLSIDPISSNSNEKWMNVRINRDAFNTDFGWIMFEADRLLKCYSQGRDNVSGTSMGSSIPGFKNILQISDSISRTRNEEVWSRFWFYPRHNAVELNRNAIYIKEAFMGVKTETMKWMNDELVPARNEIDAAAEEFVEFFNANYQSFCYEQPVFMQLEQLMRLLLISEWIRKFNIPVDLDWIERYRKEIYRIPRYTPTSNVSLIRTNSLTTFTNSMYGGVNLDVVLHSIRTDENFNHWTQSAFKAAKIVRKNDEGKFDFKSYKKRFIGVVLPFARISSSNTQPFYSFDLQNNLTYNLKRRRKKSTYSLSKLLEDWELALPKLIAINPKGRDGIYESTSIEGKPGSDIKVFHYELYDEEGLILGRFNQHEIEQDLVEFVVKPESPTNEWLLYPQTNGTVWAKGPENKILAFDVSSGLLIGEQIGDELIQFQYNEFGVLFKIQTKDGLHWIEFVHGNNGHRIIGYRTDSGEDVSFLNKNFAKKAERSILATNEVGEEFRISYNTYNGNWIWKNNPGKFPHGLNYLNQPELDFGSLISRSSVNPSLGYIVSGGGLTYLVHNSKIITLQIPFGQLTNGWLWKYPQEDNLIIPVKRTLDGRLALLHETEDGIEAFIINKDHSIITANKDAVLEIAHFTRDEISFLEDIYRENVKSHSTDEIKFLHISSVDKRSKTVIVQFGSIKFEIQLKNLNSYSEIVDKIVSLFDELSTNTKIVVCRDNLQRSDIGQAKENESTIDYNYNEDNIFYYLTSLYVDLKNKLPAYDFYFGGDFETDMKKIMPNKDHFIRSANDIGAYHSHEWDRDAISIKINNIIETGIKTSEIQKGKEFVILEQPNLLILTAHRNESFINDIRLLAERNAFNDKVIVFFSCYEGGTEIFNSNILQNKGAKSILFYPTTINGDAVKQVIQEFSKLVGELGKVVKMESDIQELLNQAIENVLRKFNTETRQKELHQLKNSINQTSFNLFFNDNKYINKS